MKPMQIYNHDMIVYKWELIFPIYWHLAKIFAGPFYTGKLHASFFLNIYDADIHDI